VPDAPNRDPQSKVQHIDACLTDAVEYRKSAGFERYEFVNQALPEVSLADVDLSTELCGKRLGAPLMISPMTGGVDRAHALNQRLAAAAEKFQIPMGVGSQRVGLEDDARGALFQVRDAAPTTFVFGNIGGAQLVKGWGADHARRAVEMIRADALFLHLNPMQEAIQGGDQDFRGLTAKIAEVTRALDDDGIPVFAREVGFGISEEAARALVDAGVKGIDCAGAGGTSWAKVEGIVAKTERRKVMGRVFGEWGIPTTESIQAVRRVTADLPLIATGGLRSGVDVAKAIALGADLGSMARPFLIAADADLACEFIEQTLEELRVCMFGVGAGSIGALKGSSSLVARS
jgi:isopentenyl-diphosphate delta-isomerase